MLKTVKSLIFITCIIISAIAHAQTWETITSKNDVRDLYCSGDYCWVASTGGVVRINIHDFFFEEYDRDDGLVSNQCTVIGEYNGQILAGTQFHGISVFDGTSWYSDSRFDTLQNEYITCIEESNDNHLWIGTKDGVFIYNGQKWTRFTKIAPYTHHVVYAIMFDETNVTWVFSDKGISKYNGEIWWNYSHPTLNSTGFGKAAIDVNNAIWLTSLASGIYCRFDSVWTNYSAENSILQDNRVVNVAVDFNNNRKWFGTEFGDVYSCYDSTLHYETSLDSVINTEKSTAIAVDSKSGVWVGTEKGILYYDGTNCQRINISKFLQSNAISSIVNGQNDGIWFGTSAGATLYNKDGWQTFDRTNTDMEFDNFYDLDVGNDGQVWGVHYEEGAIQYDGIEWMNYNRNNSTFPLDFPQCVTTENESKVWIGGYCGGLAKYDGADFTLTEGPDNIFKFRTITDIKVDKWGVKWISNSFSHSNIDGVGLVRYDDYEDEWQTFNTSNSIIAHNNILCITFENDTTLWVGTTNGVSRYDGHNWTTYTTENSGLAYHFIVSIAVDLKGRKWFGTSDHGVSVFDGESWVNYRMANSMLAGNYVGAINVDKDGNVYLATSGGLNVYHDMETGIQEKNCQLPLGHQVLQNYPNPFNGSTTIQYEISKSDRVELQIFNIQGQQVTTLYQGYQASGLHSMKWDGLDEYGNSVSSGIYFCRLSINKQLVKTHQILLLK